MRCCLDCAGIVRMLVWKAMFHLITGDVGVLVLNSEFRLHHGVS